MCWTIAPKSISNKKTRQKKSAAFSIFDSYEKLIFDFCQQINYNINKRSEGILERRLFQWKRKSSPSAVSLVLAAVP